MADQGEDSSPFEFVLGQIDLPRQFREQYLLTRGSGNRVILEGKMHRVWRRGRWLWPLFWLAARFEMLFPETGRDVPTLVEITSGNWRGEPLQTWRRTFRFPNEHRRFTSRMAYDERIGRIVELVGPGAVLGVVWEIRFEAPRTLRLGADEWVLRLGPRRLRLPAWLMGTGRAVETADDSADDVIHIDLTLAHPLLGDVFGYEGTFRVRRENLVTDRTAAHE